MTTWFLLAGALLVLMALIGTAVEDLPLSTGLIYLVIGFMLGPSGAGMLMIDVDTDAPWLEFAFELAVIVSLFTVGLKLRLPLSDRLWRLPVALASVSMLITIALFAVAAVIFLPLPWPAALLLAAVLAPTDPVLASDVQIKDPGERDVVRFSLTAEGGMNDGTAFPFVMLGLGLLGLHEIGEFGWRWVAVDLVWGVSGGLLIGAVCGIAVGRLVLWVRSRREEPLALEEFLTLGLIALSYGLALLAETLGFLSVFAAGVAMRRLESRAAPVAVRSAAPPAQDAADGVAAAAEEVTPGRMVSMVLGFNERFERIAELGAVLLLGALLSAGYFSAEGLVLGVLMLCLVRPVSVWLGIVTSRVRGSQRALIGWFGVRGVGSLYYLFYAINKQLPAVLIDHILPAALTVLALSIVVHGVSATPLMRHYVRWRKP